MRFAPSPAEAAEIAVTATDEIGVALRAACATLGISNIRVIRRIEGLVRSATEQLTKYEAGVTAQAIQSVILLAWCVFAPNESPSLDYILSRRFGLYGEPQLESGAEADAAWAATLQEYGFIYADELDLVLLEGVRNGFFEPSALAGPATALDQKIKAQGADDSFSEAWNLFHDTFADNADLVVTEIHASFLQNMAFISPLNLNGTVRLMKDLGRVDLATDVIEKYVAQPDKPRSLFDLDDYAFASDIDDPDVIAAFSTKFASYHDDRDPVSVLMSIGQGWNSEDLDYLGNLDSAAYEQMFKGHEGKELRKLISNALKFDRVSNATGAMQRITAKAKQALTNIGRESTINARRVRKYGIVIEDVAAGGEHAEPHGEATETTR